MLKNISDKDFKLLLFMFLIVVVVGIGYWGIFPQIKAFNNMEDEIDEAEAEAELNEMKLMNLGFVSAMAEDYEEKIVERKNEFHPIMKSSQVDRMVTSMALEHNLEVFDLRFTMPKNPTERMAYKNSELYSTQLSQKAEYEAAAMAAVNNEDDMESMVKEAEDDVKGKDKDKKKKKDEEEEEAVTLDIFGAGDGYRPNTDIYAVPVTLTVGGRVEDINRFVDSIIDMEKHALLTSFSWGEYRVVVRKDAEGNIIPSTIDPDDGIIRKTLTVRFELYMCDTSDVGEEE